LNNLVVEKVKTGVGRATSTLYAALDKNIDKFELYIVRNIFKVPLGFRV